MTKRKAELAQRENGLWVILSGTGAAASVVETGHLDPNLAALDLDSYVASQTLSPITRGWLKVAERLAGHLKQGRHTRAKTQDILGRRDVQRLLMEQGYRCPISGSYFTHDAFDGAGRSPFQPSIDRRDPSRGYERDNIRVVCLLVNMAMSDWGEDPLRKIARRIVTLGETPGLRPDGEYRVDGRTTHGRSNTLFRRWFTPGTAKQVSTAPLSSVQSSVTCRPTRFLGEM